MSFSLFGWAAASAEAIHYGQMWTVGQRYDGYRAKQNTRKPGLVWTLTFLNLTPHMVTRMMISRNRRRDGKSRM